MALRKMRMTMKVLTTRAAGWASPPTSRMSWTSRRQRRHAASSAIRLSAFRARGGAGSAGLRRDPCRDRLERVFGAGAVGPSGLREVGAAASAFAAERFGAHLDQIDRIV